MTQHTNSGKGEGLDEIIKRFQVNHDIGEAGILFDEETHRKALKSSLLAYIDGIVLGIIGENDEHKHLTRIYDEGCQVKDMRNTLRREQRKAWQEKREGL